MTVGIQTFDKGLVRGPRKPRRTPELEAGGEKGKVPRPESLNEKVPPLELRIDEEMKPHCNLEYLCLHTGNLTTCARVSLCSDRTAHSLQDHWRTRPSVVMD
jgi:hypothetical protein